MKIQIGEGMEADVSFNHVRFAPSDTARDYTVAHVTWEYGILIGKAVCGKDDQYCKYAGRRMALTRALACVPRENRRAIWTGLQKRGVRFY